MPSSHLPAPNDAARPGSEQPAARRAPRPTIRPSCAAGNRLGRLRVALALGAALVAAGCADEPCDLVCEKSVECQPEASSFEACVATCEELSTDEAYADALEEQSECVAGQSCESLANGACVPEV